MASGPMPPITAEDPAGSGSADRRVLRKVLLERRLALPAAEWEWRSNRVRTHLQDGFPQFAAMRVGFCWPLNKEVDLLPLIEKWAGEGKAGFSALLPVVIDEDRALRFRAWGSDTAMVNDRYGIPTPASGSFVIPEALLVPVNGFDAAGYRLGYGGGYFDRTLALLSPRPLVVGVGFELARLDSICPQPHDQALDLMVTEDGIFRSAR